MEANITIKYGNVKDAEAVMKAISPDNIKVPPGLFIKTRRSGSKVLTYIRYRGKLPTFISTIDDLLSCISIAEKTLRAAKKLGKK